MLKDDKLFFELKDRDCATNKQLLDLNDYGSSSSTETEGTNDATAIKLFLICNILI